MALSQVQCLDNNNVNWKYTESKPEFFYSEEQRLALEALVAKGTDAFYEVLKKENIRDFLSELEMKRILEGIEPYDPSNSHINGDSAKERDSDSAKERDGGGSEKEEEEEEGSENSLEYWPMKSDCSIPQLDLGWPDVVAYRGVTRATVYMQPPIDGQPHIKEVVRKIIVQAQKVIAVVMDIFTDVDIFKDMLDAGFKRKVGVYIILDETSVKYFLQMCERAQMHAGHLKNLRVRCTCGTEFYTHSSTMFKGALAQKFMFVDGDRAVCGAYSFTWSAARTDRNIITVLSGQVVESFDKQFQDLYLNSKGVSLKMIPLEDEPEPEPLLQHTVVSIAPDPEVARRLINPKYSLVKTKSASDKCGSKEENKGKAKETKQPFEEMLLNIHPALQNMEKVNMFDYLPTWVEPDPEPGSEVLGYINIIDPNIKNPQLSQINRIKICDTSQAMAQHMMMIKQNKEKEAKQTQQAQVDTRAPPSPAGGTDSPQMLETKRAHKAPESPKPKVSQAQESFRPQAPEVPESPKLKTLEVPESPKPKTPESPDGAFALLANSQHLHHNENETQDPLKNGQGNQPPVPKPRTVPVADLILKNNVINESQSKNMNKQENKSSINEEENKAPMVNGLHKVPVKPKTPTELKATNRPCAQNGFVENGKGDENEDDETEDYNTVSDQDSFSDCSSSTNHYKSTASSVSEENYDAQDYYCPIQRRHSELIPNGEAMSLQRQMSEGHISRGTFVSPLKISQSMQEMRQQDQKYMQRNKTLEVEIKRALDRSRKQSAIIKTIKRIQSNDSSQRRPFHHFESRAPYRASLDYRDSPGPNKELSMSSNYRDTSAAVSRFGNAPPAAPAHQHRKSSLPSFLDSQGAPEGMSTPFGIPCSKLSQSKHLKNRLAVHAGDLKRRGLKDQ